MQIELTELQKQVDQQIEARVSRICAAEWRKINVLPNGRVRRKTLPVTYPQVVIDLLGLRQELYNGRDPEEISAIISNGEIQNIYLNA